MCDHWLDEIRRRRNRGTGCRAHRYRIRTEYELVDEINGDVNVQIIENHTRNEEESQMITDILEIMRSGRLVNNTGSKRVDRKGLAEWKKKVNRVVPEIQTTIITDTNQVGLKIGGCEGKGSKEPRWKRRIKDFVAELWRHVNILERFKQGKLKRKGNFKGRKNRLTKKQN